MSLRRQVRFTFALVSSLVLLAGCEKSPTGANNRPVTLHLSASGLVTTVNLVVVKVTAADIPVPLVFNFPVTGGSISGSIEVPAGSDRTITASAYDAGNTETHRGVVTMDLPAGTQPVLTLQLLPLTSTQPITITITSVVITLSQASLTLTVGLADPAPLTATIKDASGNPVNGASVKWATTDPQRPRRSTGRLAGATPTGAGTARIVATFAGVAASCDVTVFGGQTASLTMLTNQLADPVYATAPANGDRLFVVQRAGVIRLLKNGLLQPTAISRSHVRSTHEQRRARDAQHGLSSQLRAEPPVLRPVHAQCGPKHNPTGRAIHHVGKSRRGESRQRNAGSQHGPKVYGFSQWRPSHVRA